MLTRDKDQLQSLEREGWDALTRGRARQFYDEVLAADAVMVFRFGVMEREDAIDAMTESPPWDDYRFDDVSVHDLGAGVAVIAYRVHAEREGERPFDARLASTYARTARGWRMVMHQQSP